MPVISCKTSLLWRSLGEEFDQERFEKLCFDFGIELDDVEKGEEGEVYKIEIPANRYDLLCIEGLSRALRVFLGKEDPPVFRIVKPKGEGEIIKQTPETHSIRPFCVGAVLRGVTLDKDSYASFIDLQDKLHHNICRRRTLVSIGTHDLDSIKGPFLYDARPPKDIRFVPLNKKEEVNAVKLFEDIRANEAHLKPFLSIIENSPLYPVIYDSNGTVLSLPPVINGDVSKITLNTKNIFIEITATDRTKAHIVLNTVVAMFSQYCVDPFTVEPVKVVEGENVSSTPDFETSDCLCDIQYVNKLLGLKLGPDAMISYLKRMCLSASLEDGTRLRVKVPITRSDVLHACDIVEDVGIAYGYNNLAVVHPQTVSMGKQNELNRLTDKLRVELALAGYTEILTLSLCSKEENFKFLNHEDDGSAVVIANPKTIEFQVGRTNLLTGLLKTLNHNRKLPLPLRLFEVSDVMLVDKDSEVGAINRRHLAAAFYGKRSGFEDIHGLLDQLMMVLMSAPTHTDPKSAKVKKVYSYRIEESRDPVYFPGRCADVFVATSEGEVKAGSFGILHPKVLTNFALTNVCSALELDVEIFL